jgi:hypothetical protein
VREAADLAPAYLAATGRRRPVVPVRPYGRITFELYLTEHLTPRRPSYRKP